MSPQATTVRANQALTDFIADLDPRAILWMYSNIEDTPLDQLVAAQVDQLRQALALRTEIDVRAWNANVLEFLGGAANEIDWTRFAGLSSRQAAGGLHSTAGPPAATATVSSQPQEPSGANGVQALPAQPPDRALPVQAQPAPWDT